MYSSSGLSEDDEGDFKGKEVDTFSNFMGTEEKKLEIT